MTARNKNVQKNVPPLDAVELAALRRLADPPDRFPNGLRPEEIGLLKVPLEALTASSPLIIPWECPKCGTIYEEQVRVRVQKADTGHDSCPKCGCAKCGTAKR